MVNGSVKTIPVEDIFMWFGGFTVKLVVVVTGVD
jgi:hypothetical protein